MKRYFAILGIMTALAACGPSQQAGKVDETAVQETQPPPAPVAPAVQKPSDQEKGIDVLAGMGIAPNFQYAVAYDIVDRNQEGKARHRVLLEVLGGDIDDAVDRMGALLANLGYEKTKDTNNNGRHEEVFRKQGTPTLVLLAQPAVSGPPLKHGDAVGSIHIMWNIP